MQLISPWNKGETRSLFVATVRGSRLSRDRMAAPKTLDPDDTPFFVRGIMRSSTIRRKEDARAAGAADGTSLVPDIM